MKKRIENERIMGAAVSACSKYGCKKTALEDIAVELGILSGSMYAYTQSKRALYEEVWRWRSSSKRSIAIKGAV